jgi:hypothetical protein
MSYTYSLNTSQIIHRALQSINVVPKGKTADNADYQYALDMLNGMLKSWQAEGIRLWKRRQAVLFPALTQYDYELGSVSGADHCTNTYVKTTLSAAEALGQTALSVTSSTGMTAGDNVGIELDDGTRQWTTITTVNSSVLITVNTALTGAAASGNTVVTYTSKINRPLDIILATTLDLSDSNLSETTMQAISHDQYKYTPVKSSSGRPNNFYYDKLLNNSLPYTGTLYVYPTPDDVNKIIKFTYYDSFADVVSTTDKAEFPQEWTLAIVSNLALLLAKLGYGKATEAQLLEPIATMQKAMLLRNDSDTESLFISPDNC